MDHFVLHSEYAPTGNQQAIEKLVKGFKEGNSVRHCLVSLAQEKLLRWQMSSHN